MLENKLFETQKLGYHQLSNIHVSSLLKYNRHKTTEVSLTIVFHTDIWKKKIHKTSFSERFTFKQKAFLYPLIMFHSKSPWRPVGLPWVHLLIFLSSSDLTELWTISHMLKQISHMGTEKEICF